MRGGGWGCVLVIAYLFVPGLIIAYITHSYSWILIGPIVMGGLLLAIAALPIKRKITRNNGLTNWRSIFLVQKAHMTGMTQFR